MTEAFYGAGLRKGEGSKPFPISRNRARLSSVFWKACGYVPVLLSWAFYPSILRSVLFLPVPLGEGRGEGLTE